jgi:hypothetical protein
MYWRVALLVLFVASVPQAKAEPPEEQALRLLNHYRQLAGLTPVKLDPKLSAGCMEPITWCKTKAPTQWLGSILTPSGRTGPVRPPRVRHVPRRQICSPASLISASQSTPGWPACITCPIEAGAPGLMIEQFFGKR